MPWLIINWQPWPTRSSISMAPTNVIAQAVLAVWTCLVPPQIDSSSHPRRRKKAKHPLVRLVLVNFVSSSSWKFDEKNVDRRRMMRSPTTYDPATSEMQTLRQAPANNLQSSYLRDAALALANNPRSSHLRANNLQSSHIDANNLQSRMSNLALG